MTIRYLKLYLGHWLAYPPFFFTHAPWKRWWDFLGSTHRVARECAKTQMAIRDAEVWDKIPIRNRQVEQMESNRAKPEDRSSPH